jgi:hypothetical protein
MAAIFALLPKDLQIEVHEYNVEHRPMMKQVSEELFMRHHRYYHRYVLNDVLDELEYEYSDFYTALPFAYDIYDTYCDGYDCEKKYNDDFEFKQYECLGHTFNFCCGYCEWEVTYDIRKSYRRGLRAQPQAQAQTQTQT